MFNFKNRFATLAGMLLFVCALVVLLSSAGKAETEQQKALRSFYLTQSTHNGGQALSACAAGYHMASLWEIFDPSNLRYDTQLGLTLGDSGFGPPSGELAFGWIRTGTPSGGAGTEMIGQANCRAWTESTGAVRGTAVSLTEHWTSTFVDRISWWGKGLSSCSETHHVWCVQD